MSIIIELILLTTAGQIYTVGCQTAREKLYELPWYVISEKQKKTLIIVMMRFDKTAVFTIGKFTNISFATFLLVKYKLKKIVL